MLCVNSFLTTANASFGTFHFVSVPVSPPCVVKWPAARKAALDEMAAKDVQLIDKAPRKGAEGLNIAFLHPKSTCGVLTELCEDPSKM